MQLSSHFFKPHPYCYTFAFCVFGHVVHCVTHFARHRSIFLTLHHRPLNVSMLYNVVYHGISYKEKRRKGGRNARASRPSFVRARPR